MRHLTRTAAPLAALAAMTMSGCVRDEPPKPSNKPLPRSSAKAKCAGSECRVRITCKGRLYVRLGPAPVRIHTTKTAFRTTIAADFAGSRQDSVVRC